MTSDRMKEERLQREMDGRRELLQISAAHRLTGYDWNVLRQWESHGFAGPRPVLSFELQAQRDRERDEIEREIEHERLLARRRREEEEKGRAEWKKKQAEHEQWRKDNPELAAAEDARRAEEARERAEARRWAKEQLEAERKEGERRERIQAFVHSHSPQELNAHDFLDWVENIATEEQLKAFDADCVRRAKRESESPWERLLSWLPIRADDWYD